MTYRITPKALADVRDITKFIGQDNPKAAEDWFTRIERRFTAVGEMPGMGVSRPEFGAGVRVSALGQYLILYRDQSGRVDIVRVVHGRRDPASWLDD
jgi:toxin ParE1/3/4